MIDKGASGNDVGVALLVVVAALLMAAVPFAMEKAKNWGEWAFYLLFGIGLGCVNYTMAIGAVGHVRDLGAGPVRELITKAAGLDARIERYRNSRSQLPQFKWTTPAGVAAARRAADAAQISREDECRRRGKYCRRREADEREALAAFKRAEADRALTERAERLDADIRRLEDERAKLGPIPETIDAQAARLAKVVGRFVDLGNNPIEAVADAVIHILAVFAELIGLAGPRVILTAIGRERVVKTERSRAWRWPFRRSRAAPAAPEPAALETAAVAETPATPAPARKSRKSRASPVRESGDVREWHKSRTMTRAGAKTKPGDAYAAYRGWCVEAGKVPVSLTAFGYAMKAKPEEGGCGVEHIEKNKRGHYVDLVVVAGPRLAVSNE